MADFKVGDQVTFNDSCVGTKKYRKVIGKSGVIKSIERDYSWHYSAIRYSVEIPIEGSYPESTFIFKRASGLYMNLSSGVSLPTGDETTVVAIKRKIGHLTDLCDKMKQEIASLSNVISIMEDLSVDSLSASEMTALRMILVLGGEATLETIHNVERVLKEGKGGT